MTDPTDDPARLVDLMEQVWSSVDELASSLAPQDWDRPTDCPGWTVKDQFAHMAGNESGILGRPRSEGAAAPVPYVRNAIGESNEREVELRRAWPPEKVLAEWREVTGERLRVLRSLSAADWDTPAWAPPGEMPHRQILRFRIFDAWVHEQDVRRATGRPGHLRGDVARFCGGMMTGAMPYVVGKKAAAPEGATVVFDIAGGPEGPFSIGVEGGRAKPVDRPDSPSVTLGMDFESFSCLACGRLTAERALESGRATVSGDAGLGRRVLAEMNFVP